MYNRKGKGMTSNSRSRKWQVTINNPLEKGYTHERIMDVMGQYKNCIYWCMSDETGEEGTFHTHIYLHCTSGVLFSTMLNRFGGGHFEMCKGTSIQNREYVRSQRKGRRTMWNPILNMGSRLWSGKGNVMTLMTCMT